LVSESGGRPIGGGGKAGLCSLYCGEISGVIGRQGDSAGRQSEVVEEQEQELSLPLSCFHSMWQLTVAHDNAAPHRFRSNRHGT
jgi:hypothetical protein